MCEMRIERRRDLTEYMNNFPPSLLGIGREGGRIEAKD
jgi:hypothetical protein